MTETAPIGIEAQDAQKHDSGEHRSFSYFMLQNDLRMLRYWRNIATNEDSTFRGFAQWAVEGRVGSIHSKLSKINLEYCNASNEKDYTLFDTNGSIIETRRRIVADALLSIMDSSDQIDLLLPLAFETLDESERINFYNKLVEKRGVEWVVHTLDLSQVKRMSERDKEGLHRLFNYLYQRMEYPSVVIDLFTDERALYVIPDDLRGEIFTKHLSEAKFSRNNVLDMYDPDRIKRRNAGQHFPNDDIQERNDSRNDLIATILQKFDHDQQRLTQEILQTPLTHSIYKNDSELQMRLGQLSLQELAVFYVYSRSQDSFEFAELIEQDINILQRTTEKVLTDENLVLLYKDEQYRLPLALALAQKNRRTISETLKKGLGIIDVDSDLAVHESKRNWELCPQSETRMSKALQSGQYVIVDGSTLVMKLVGRRAGLVSRPIATNNGVLIDGVWYAADGSLSEEMKRMAEGATPLDNIDTGDNASVVVMRPFKSRNCNYEYNTAKELLESGRENKKMQLLVGWIIQMLSKPNIRITETEEY